MQNDIRNYALNVIKQRQQNISRPESSMTYYKEFAQMVTTKYASTEWTPQSLREMYIELENILATLNSLDELESDEAIILLFGSYTDIIRKVRRSVDAETTPQPVIVKMVERAMGKQASWFWKTQPTIIEIANAVQYFLKLVIREAINESSRNRRRRVSKYDVIVGLNKVKKTTIQTYISKTEKNEEVAAATPVAAPAAAPVAVHNNNKAVIETLMKNKKNLLDQADVWKRQVEESLATAKTSRAEKKFAEDALAQCKKELEWVKRRTRQTPTSE